MVRPPETATDEDIVVVAALRRHTLLVDDRSGGVFVPNPRQPNRIRWQRRSLLADAAEGDSRGRHAGRIHSVHHALFPRRVAALEPFRRLRVSRDGGVVRIHEIIP